MPVMAQIAALEEELRNTPYNKATEHHIGLLKAKLARLRAKASAVAGRKGGRGFALPKAGDATVVIVGFPSVGKSTLLAKLTGAKPRIAPWPFTTLSVLPGMLDYQGAEIQILDLPGLLSGAASGAGRGREVLAVVRTADLIVLLLDPLNAEEQLDVLNTELEKAGIRLNRPRPDVRIRRMSSGGLRVVAPKSLSLAHETVKAVVRELGLLNAEIVIGHDLGLDELIDAVEGNRVYLPGLVVLNKVDTVHDPGLLSLLCSKLGALPISAERGTGLDELKAALWSRLSLKRLFLKEPGRKASAKPLIVRGRVDVAQLCKRLRLRGKAVGAKIWGSSAKFEGQIVGLEHELADRDVIEIQLAR